MANFKEIHDLLLKKIPVEDSYSQEKYGAFNCDNLQEVKKILYCVTPSDRIDKYFKDNDYDLLIAHHIGSSSHPYMIFHTALDFCKGGLTDYWSTLLKIKDPQYIQKNAGLYGKIDPIPFDELVEKIDKEIDGIEGQIYSKNEIIESVAVCSGLGAIIQKSVEALDVDCYILGQTWSDVENTKLNGMIETGHTKSERIGVHTIRNILKDYNLQIDVAPLDIDVYGSEVHVKKFSWY